MLPAKCYRVGVNILARAISGMMRSNNIQGHFCIGPRDTFFEFQGMRLAYHFGEFGAAGNVDSGGNTEDLTRAKLNSLITSHSVFYDIGAHEGLFSISVQKNDPTTIVHAFEPKSAGLKANIALNSVSVHVHETAIGDRIGLVSMTDDDRSSNHVTGYEGAIPITTIDAIVASGLLAPNFMKLDIEGFEYQALLGAQQTIKNSRPVILTEINHCHFRYNSDFRPFADLMSGLDYNFMSLRGDTLSKVELKSGAISLSDLPPSDEDNYWWMPIQP